MDLHKALPADMILGRHVWQGRALQKEATQGLLCLSLPPRLAFPFPILGSYLDPKEQAQALGQTLWLRGRGCLCLFLIRAHPPPF